MTIARRHGRPRSTTWIGKLGVFVNDFTATRLAGELDADLSQVYRWVRGDHHPPIEKAIAIAEIARASGTDLTLEDIYETEVTRVRMRIRTLSSL